MEYLQSFDREQLETFYQANCQHIYGQEYLRRGNHAKKLLRAAMANCPHLSSLAYSTFLKNHEQLEAPSWDSLSSVARRILQEPTENATDFYEQVHGNEVDTEFWAFLESGHDAGVLRRLTELHLTDMVIPTWIERLPLLLEVFSSTKNVRSLGLKFKREWEPTPAGSLKLAECLGNLELLHTLELSFPRWEDSGICVVSLSNVISPRQHWVSLRNLSLENLLADSHQLRCL